MDDDGESGGRVDWALAELRRHGYRVFLGHDGLWVTWNPRTRRWMKAVDNRQLVNRAETLPP